MNSDVRKVQSIQLEILNNFILFCQKNNLRWYIIGGSLIGVLRHKGFIPWDDDIDIGMPRKDYDRFISLQNKYPSGYTLINHQTDRNWNFNFSQFVDNESDIIVNFNEIPRQCKIWIDIFPIDGLPKNTIHRWLHMKHILFYRYLIQISNIQTQVDTHKVGRPFWEKIILKLFHYIPLGKFINEDKILARMEQSLKKYDFDDMEYAGNLLGKYREKEIVPKSYWGNPILLPFENINVNCPNEYHKLQTHLYGSYMNMPPIEKRVCHDITIIKTRE